MTKQKKARGQSGQNRNASQRPRAAASNAPHPIDVHVGSRVRQRRTLLGLSQEKLGQAVGLTFQQIQKYERGSNRIGASRLHELSQILDVPISFFFDGADEETSPKQPPYRRRKGKKVDRGDFLQRRETLELIRAYYQIPDALVRKRLFDTIKALAKGTTTKT